MLKIEKSKSIRICLTWLISFALVFLSTLCYFLGWEFEIRTFLIYLAIITSELALLWILCLILVKTNKSYYLIDINSIKFQKGNQQIFQLETGAIIKINYVKFIWALLFQMGSGYLHIEYIGNADKVKPSIICQNSTKMISIAMTLKQAKEVSKMLDKDLQIK